MLPGKRFWREKKKGCAQGNGPNLRNSPSQRIKTPRCGFGSGDPPFGDSTLDAKCYFFVDTK